MVEQNRGVDPVAAVGGGGGGEGGGAPTPGSAMDTPMFVRQMPAKKEVSTMFSPHFVAYFMYNSMNDKSGFAAFTKMTERGSDEARVAITVGSGTQFIEDFYHHFKTLGANPFLLIPTDGVGTCLADDKFNARGTRVYNADLSGYHHLIKEFNKITFDDLKKTMAMIWGGTNATRVIPATTDDMVIGTINPNAAGNAGLLDQWRQQMRILSSLFYTYIEAHLTKDNLRSFIVTGDEFTFTDPVTGQTSIDGLFLLHKILQVAKPSVLVDVELMHAKMKALTMDKCGDDVAEYITQLTDWKNKINVAKGTTYISDDLFLMTFFKGVESASNEQFRNKASDYKDDWTVGDITNHNDILQKLKTLHKNMKNEGRWEESNSKDAKIVALVSKLQSLQGKVKKLQGAKADTALATTNTSGKGGKVGKEGSWQFVKSGEFKDHPVTGKKHVWCEHHGTGAYMPHPHNHEEWKKRKAEKQKSFTERRASKKVRFEEDKDRKGSGGKQPSKLQLDSALRASLTTHYQMTSADADKLFNDAYDEASSSKD